MLPVLALFLQLQVAESSYVGMVLLPINEYFSSRLGTLFWLFIVALGDDSCYYLRVLFTCLEDYLEAGKLTFMLFELFLL